MDFFKRVMLTYWVLIGLEIISFIGLVIAVAFIYKDKMYSLLVLAIPLLVAFIVLNWKIRNYEKRMNYANKVAIDWANKKLKRK